MAGTPPRRLPARATATRIAGADAENTLAADAGPRMRREPAHSGSFADDLQLRDRARTLQRLGRQQRGVTLLLEPVTELTGQWWSYPAPYRPASMMIVTAASSANCTRRVSPPRIPTSSSLTILTTCWAAEGSRHLCTLARR